MAASFDCPHCGATYPFKEVLVGRPVRCTACKKPFKLGADGIATAVTRSQAQTAAAKTVSQSTAANSGPSAPAEPSATATATDPSPAAGSRSQSGTARARKQASQTRSKSASARHKRIQSSISKNLSDAANAALQSEKVKRESERIEKDQSSRRLKAQSGGTDRISPAVLTGTGDQEAANSRRWLLGCLVVVILAPAAIWWISRGDPVSDALASFSAPTDVRGRQRLATMRQRAWFHLPGLPVLTNLDEASVGATITFDLRDCVDVFNEQIGDRTYVQLAGLDGWVGGDQAEALERLLEGLDPNINHQRRLRDIERAGIPFSERQSVLQSLIDKGIDNRLIDLLDWMLHDATTDAAGSNVIRDRFVAGLVPRRIELIPFSDRDGNRLRMVGTKVKLVAAVSYRGRLLRFVDPAWHGSVADKQLDQPHVLHVEIADRQGRYGKSPYGF